MSDFLRIRNFSRARFNEHGWNITSGWGDRVHPSPSKELLVGLRGSFPAPPSLLGRDFGQPFGSSLPQEVHLGVDTCPPLSLIFNHQLCCSHEPFPSEDVNLSDSGGRPFPGSVFLLSPRRLCAPSLTLSPGLSATLVTFISTPVFSVLGGFLNFSLNS